MDVPLAVKLSLAIFAKLKIQNNNKVFASVNTSPCFLIVYHKLGRFLELVSYFAWFWQVCIFVYVIVDIKNINNQNTQKKVKQLQKR